MRSLSSLVFFERGKRAGSIMISIFFWIVSTCDSVFLWLLNAVGMWLTSVFRVRADTLNDEVGDSVV